MKKVISILLAALLSLTVLPAHAEGRTLLRAIVINMGEDKSITDSMYDSFYKESSAEEGIRQVIADGRFLINGIAIPADEEAFEKECPDGYFQNGTPWLMKSGADYQVGGFNTVRNYADAAFAAATGFMSGLEVRLYDIDDDGYTDEINMDYVEAVIINEIIDNGDGTYSVLRSEVAPEWIWENDGRMYDGEHFTKDSGEKITAENLDPSISSGDMALFWYGPSGWAMRRAHEVKGILVAGEDHHYYQIGDTQYQDAMRFSRDNIIISNRCGELTNTHKYFGLMNGDKEVSLWFVPTTDPQVYAAPAGFTTGENAAFFLQTAIEYAEEQLAATDSEQLAMAIERAESALQADSASDILDYHAYLLYLVLNGSGDDIGAEFAGYSYAGLTNTD